MVISEVHLSPASKYYVRRNADGLAFQAYFFQGSRPEGRQELRIDARSAQLSLTPSDFLV